MKLFSILAKSIQQLKDHHIEDFSLSAEEIIAYVLGIKRLDLFMDLNRELDPVMIEKIEIMIARRCQSEPLQYILGFVDFLGCTIAVDSSVLIPRPETELLTELAIKEMNEGKVLDVCTGSGCIAIALKKYLAKIDVYASDISKDALQLAMKNARNNGVHIHFREGCLLQPFLEEKFDFLIANPPYVSQEEYCHLQKEVHFEPKIALVADQGGLEFYQKISIQIPKIMNKGGKIFLEMGENQGKQLKKIFTFGKAHILFDLAGRERFFFLEIE